MGMFEKAGGTPAIQGGKTGARSVSIGQPLVAFCGWRPCAERLRLPIFLEVWRRDPRGRGYGKISKNLWNSNQFECSAFRGMNWGPCIERKKFQHPGQVRCKRWS
jgi:hypothetical protein